MKKIEKLTAGQEREMIKFREEWRKIGLSCEPVDKERTKKAVTKMYSLLGKKEPVFVFCPSPFYANLQINFCKALFKMVQEDPKLKANLRANLGDNLGDNLWANLRANLGANLGANLWERHTNYFWGQQDAAWIAFYLFPKLTLKLEKDYAEDDFMKLNLWGEVVQSANWFWVFENYVFVSDRPKSLSFDERHVLHCETGPAYEYRDGWNAFYWHGVKVTEQIIMRPHEITVDMILKEDNQEVRRVMMERMGMRRFLIEAKPEILDEDEHKVNWNRALFKVKEDVFLYVADPSTARTYAIQVDGGCKTCEEADSWMWHGRVALDGKPYKQLSRT